jgi:hypothetical protein
MKIFFSLLIASILFIFSCETNVDPVYQEPVQKSAESFSDEGGSLNSVINYEMIPLPARSPIYLDSIFSITQTIVGEIGGQIILDRSYISDRGRLVTILVDLTIPANAFNGTRVIRLTIDDGTAAVHCLPAMSFNFPLHLIQTFTGLDLQNYKIEEIDFVYIRKNGELEEVEKDAIIVNRLLGIVTVLDAELDHFSRYGWVRKSE